MSEPITVLVVDDHAVVRQGVRTLLDMHPDLQVVGEAENAEAALPLVEELVPDVVLLDLVLSGMNGVEATRQMKKISPRTQIVVLTSYAEDEHIFPALRASSLHPSFPPPEAAKQGVCNSPEMSGKTLDKSSDRCYTSDK